MAEWGREGERARERGRERERLGADSIFMLHIVPAVDTHTLYNVSHVFAEQRLSNRSSCRAHSAHFSKLLSVIVAVARKQVEDQTGRRGGSWRGEILTCVYVCVLRVHVGVRALCKHARPRMDIAIVSSSQVHCLACIERGVFKGMGGGGGGGFMS